MNATAGLLLALFAAVAALDWAAVHTKSKGLEYLCKPGCMVLLIAAAAALDPVDDTARTAAVVALSLSAVGDVFLMLRGERPSLFLAGLGAFLLAHVAYVAAFSIEGLDLAPTVAGVVLAAALVLLVGRRVVAAVRRGDEPSMATPVSAYIGVISLMVLTATGTGDVRATLGALLFAASDSLIAEHRFVRERSWQPVTIIVTYHLAQALLVWSFA